MVSENSNFIAIQVKVKVRDSPHNGQGFLFRDAIDFIDLKCLAGIGGRVELTMNLHLLQDCPQTLYQRICFQCEINVKRRVCKNWRGC